MIPRPFALLPLALATACGGSQPTRDQASTDPTSPGPAPQAAPAEAGEAREQERAPAFSGADQTGATVSLESLHGRAIVLFFYPRDGTPGCTAEACAFRDAWDRIEAAGAVVVGVSADDAASHRAFAEEHQLAFPLLADPDGTIARAYGVPNTLGMHARMTFIIDRSGVVRRIFQEVDPAVHCDEVLAVLDSLHAVEAR